MHLESFSVKNFRRLKDVSIDLEKSTTIFVGSNNSGKTSATQVFQLFLGSSRDKFTIYDFSSDCWPIFNKIGEEVDSKIRFPSITLDLWFHVTESDLYRVLELLPGFDWKDVPVGVRLEFGPKNEVDLMTRFREAHDKAKKASKKKKNGLADFHPWPRTLTDYLTRNLIKEFEVSYAVLDFEQMNTCRQTGSEFEPTPIVTNETSGKAILDSLIRVDFLNAQRHLSDSGSKGRSEDLSRPFASFYQRHLEKLEDDFEAVGALSDSEDQLNAHLATVFGPTLDKLKKLNYPGLDDPLLVIKSSLSPESILTQNTRVHYSLGNPKDQEGQSENFTLPDQYNGLGFKNLIYMVIELLEFHHRWVVEREQNPENSRAAIHLIMIEEPEAHLHAQIQQVFIKKVLEILPTDSKDPFLTQLLVTTHSSHIIYEHGFQGIRYFHRGDQHLSGRFTDVRNLSVFYNNSKPETRDFLSRYMKLTHCDLFFADAAIFVEGSVERMLLPLMIQKSAKELQSCYLSTLELGGAFAHKFKELIEFLGIATLLITDVDSVRISTTKPSIVPITKSSPLSSNEVLATQEEGLSASFQGQVGESLQGDDEDGDNFSLPSGVCMTNEIGSVSSNQTLVRWIPKLGSIEELLNLDATKKLIPFSERDTSGPSVRVAYQTRTNMVWKESEKAIAGRTFEESFAFTNLKWCQDPRQKDLNLYCRDGDKLSIDDLVTKIHNKIRAKSFGKAEFALVLMMKKDDEWIVPHYIEEGLHWLRDQLLPNWATESAITQNENI